MHLAQFKVWQRSQILLLCKCVMPPLSFPSTGQHTCFAHLISSSWLPICLDLLSRCLRKPTHLIHEDYLFMAVLFGQQNTNLVIIIFICRTRWWISFVRNNILLQRQRLMRTHAERILPSAALCQRCWDELGWCHITCNPASPFWNFSQWGQAVRRKQTSWGELVNRRVLIWDPEMERLKREFWLGSRPGPSWFFSVPILEGLIVVSGNTLCWVRRGSGKILTWVTHLHEFHFPWSVKWSQ